MSAQQTEEHALAMNKKGVEIQCIIHKVPATMPTLSNWTVLAFIRNKANLQIYKLFKKRKIIAFLFYKFGLWV